jgi:hypothetical protein
VINAILMYVWGLYRGVVHTGRSSRNYRVELVPVQALMISSEQLNLTRKEGRGKRFESARRLYILPAKPVKTKSVRPEHRGLCQQNVSSRLSESLVLCIGVIQVCVGHSRWRR